MRNILFTFLILQSSIVFSQNNNWKEFSNEEKITVNIDKTKIYEIEYFKFDVVWDSKLRYSENIGYYGGIKKMSIYKNDKKLQIINDIEDSIALGNISFIFYDYNFDGYLDFTIPLNCGRICWKKYYLYNPISNEFEHREDWDYLRIQKIDKKNKQILSEPDGMQDNRKIYQIKGSGIFELK